MPNKIKISTVFLDMDGVLTDFHRGVYDIFNKPYNYESPELNTWNFWDSWTPDVTREDVNKKCKRAFWANLNWMHDGRDIINIVLARFEPDNICLLTNPIVGGIETATGKMKWIKKHLPDYFHRTIITTASKGLLAKPGILLIDDNDENVDEFRVAGGKAITVPRPWNFLYPWSDCALEVVQLALRRFESAT